MLATCGGAGLAAAPGVAGAQAGWVPCSAACADGATGAAKATKPPWFPKSVPEACRDSPGTEPCPQSPGSVPALGPAAPEAGARRAGAAMPRTDLSQLPSALARPVPGRCGGWRSGRRRRGLSCSNSWNISPPRYAPAFALPPVCRSKVQGGSHTRASHPAGRSRGGSDTRAGRCLVMSTKQPGLSSYREQLSPCSPPAVPWQVPRHAGRLAAALPSSPHPLQGVCCTRPA